MKELIFTILRPTYILAAQVENKETGISAFVLPSLTSDVSLGGVVLMSIDEQMESCKCFDVLEVFWWMELHVTVSIESGGNRQL